MGRLDISFAIYVGLKGEKCAKNVVLIEGKQLKGEMQNAFNWSYTLCE